MSEIELQDCSTTRARLESLASELVALARELPARPSPQPALQLPERAARAYAERLRRTRHLPASLFGEPAWDILLDLFVAAEQQRPISVTSACIAAHVPATTALRWLNLLETEGLVERVADARDARRNFVRLTAAGHAAVAACLEG